MPSLCAVYDFRANRETYELSQLKKWLKGNAKSWCFQLEKGDSGYEHWQGRCSLIKKRRKHELLALMEAQGFPKPQYLEPTVKENRRRNFYVTKEDTRVDGPWKDDDVEKFIPIQFRGRMEHLRPFQRDILESAKHFDERTVNVIIDERGNHGKSVVANLARLFLGGVALPACNDGEKLIASACDILMARELRHPGIVLIDIPRSSDQRHLRGIFTAVEQIKNGVVYDMRYKFREWWFDSPAVWVFMNEMPKLEMLSADRWALWSINGRHELICGKKRKPRVPAGAGAGGDADASGKTARPSPSS